VPSRLPGRGAVHSSRSGDSERSASRRRTALRTGETTHLLAFRTYEHQRVAVRLGLSPTPGREPVGRFVRKQEPVRVCAAAWSWRSARDRVHRSHGCRLCTVEIVRRGLSTCPVSHLLRGELDGSRRRSGWRRAVWHGRLPAVTTTRRRDHGYHEYDRRSAHVHSGEIVRRTVPPSAAADPRAAPSIYEQLRAAQRQEMFTSTGVPSALSSDVCVHCRTVDEVRPALATEMTGESALARRESGCGTCDE
jgi:hypothetical protein